MCPEAIPTPEGCARCLSPVWPQEQEEQSDSEDESFIDDEESDVEVEGEAGEDDEVRRGRCPPTPSPCRLPRADGTLIGGGSFSGRFAFLWQLERLSRLGRLTCILWVCN